MNELLELAKVIEQEAVNAYRGSTGRTPEYQNYLLGKLVASRNWRYIVEARCES